SFEDHFEGDVLEAGWSTWDGYAIQNPSDTTHHAAFAVEDSQLSISFPGGHEHNMWWLAHAKASRDYLGSGTYEIKVDSPLTGAQQFGLVFQGDHPGTFLLFMLYAGHGYV